MSAVLGFLCNLLGAVVLVALIALVVSVVATVVYVMIRAVMRS